MPTYPHGSSEKGNPKRYTLTFAERQPFIYAAQLINRTAGVIHPENYAAFVAKKIFNPKNGELLRDYERDREAYFLTRRTHAALLHDRIKGRGVKVFHPVTRVLIPEPWQYPGDWYNWLLPWQEVEHFARYLGMVLVIRTPPAATVRPSFDPRQRASLVRVLRALMTMANIPVRGGAVAIAKQLEILGHDGPKEKTIKALLDEAQALEPEGP